MRKTLAVLALMIGSLLFLAAPAWAHHLYKVNRVPGGTAASPNANATTTYEALTSCPGTVKIKPNSSAQPVPATFKATKAYGGISPTPRQYLFKTSASFSTSPSATCDGRPMDNRSGVLGASVLARTGRPLVLQLALGIGLLLVGSLFVALTMHPPLALFRRRRPGSATPD